VLLTKSQPALPAANDNQHWLEKQASNKYSGLHYLLAVGEKEKNIT